MLTYEERLSQDSRWALSEGSRHFEIDSSVQRSLERIARRLGELEIPYAVAGTLAMFYRGYRRFTEDVHLLVTRQGLNKIHEELEGLGYVPPFTGSKHLRDAESGVRIEFIVTGGYPGDGKPKPVAFPDPDSVAVEDDGIRFLNLRSLVELKLASGMSNLQRGRDLVDVQEMIRVLELPREFGDGLDPYVQPKFRELWMIVHGTPKRFVRLWRNKFLTTDAKSLDEMIEILKNAASLLSAMRADGVTLDPAGGHAADYAYLVTSNPDVAKKYDMHDEAEFMDKDDADDFPTA
jgi:hypothetical protein